MRAAYLPPSRVNADVIRARRLSAVLLIATTALGWALSIAGVIALAGVMP